METEGEIPSDIIEFILDHESRGNSQGTFQAEAEAHNSNQDDHGQYSESHEAGFAPIPTTSSDTHQQQKVCSLL